MNTPISNKKLWFKAKRFGWGWTPISWQGWLVTLVYVAFLADTIINTTKYDKNVSNSASDTLIFFAPTFIIYTILFLGICYMKGEKPGWRWGGK